MKYGSKESLGMHTQVLSFGLGVPKIADRHDRIAFSKDAPRKCTGTSEKSLQAEVV